jgi:outer membrane receptor for ferrienterochelin and colicins
MCYLLGFSPLFFTSVSYAGEQNTPNPNENVSLQTLLNMQVTTASKTEEKLSDAPGVITVVTKDEIKRFGGNTLKDILDRVPSLSAQTAFYQDRSMISVRGDQDKATCGHVLLLLNGRPVRESLEGGITSEMFESFPIGIIDHIEVVRGPGSVLYGSNAFSGVINIITEDPEKLGGTIAGLVGMSGSWGANGDLRVKAGDFKGLVAIRGAENNGWDVDNYHRFIARFSKPNPNVPTAANPVNSQNFTYPDQQLGTYLNLDYKGLKLQSSYDQWYAEYFMRGDLGQNMWTKWFNDAGYSLNLIKNWKMDFNLTFTNSTLASDSGYPYVKRNSYDLVAEWANFIELSDKSKLVFGGLYNKINGKEIYSDSTQKEVSNGDIPAYAGYAQIDYWLLHGLKLIGGLQANKVGNRDADVVPRAGVIWYPFEKINFKALYGEAYRAPSINETKLLHPGLHGADSLNPEKVGTVDIGVNYNADNFQGGANYFRSSQKGIIVLVQAPGQTYRVYQNKTDIVYQGAEFEGKYYLNTNLFLMGSLLYQVNKDQTGRQNVSPTPNYLKKIGISYMSENGITLSVFDIYNDGVLDTAYTGFYNPSPRPYDLLNTNCNFNFSKFFKLHGPEYSLNVYGENLFGMKYWAPEWQGLPHQTLPASPGRRIYVSLKVAL